MRTVAVDKSKAEMSTIKTGADVCKFWEEKTPFSLSSCCVVSGVQNSCARSLPQREGLGGREMVLTKALMSLARGTGYAVRFTA